MNKSILVTAWITILFVALYKIVLQEVFHYPVSEDLHYGLLGLVGLIGFALTFPWKSVRPLRPFFGLFILLAAVQWVVFTRIERLPFIRDGLSSPSFQRFMPAEQALNLIVVVVILAGLWIIKRKRAAFFLVRGDTAAAVEPVRWLGVKAGTRWNVFGRILTLCISLGTLAFLVIAGRPDLDTAGQGIAVSAGGTGYRRDERIL